MSMIEQAKQARAASRRISSAGPGIKNRILETIAEELDRRRKEIRSENNKDIEEARTGGLKQSLLKRLRIDDAKINAMIASVKDLAAMENPVGKIIRTTELDEGLVLTRISVPIGVIGVIFESRPDALLQISILCIKSANAVILKGGSEAVNSNRILFSIITEAAQKTDARFSGALQLAESREDVRMLLGLDEYIDLLIPRGGNELVRFIKDNTKIPVLGHTDGICHVYVDKAADLDMALEIVYDAKCQYPAVCNALETLLVHTDAAQAFLPRLQERLAEVELRGDERCREIIDVKPAVDEDWLSEYNDLILSIKIVDEAEEAIDHINVFGSGHTDSIVTAEEPAAVRFTETVDSASVLWNCSTRFADGFRYGLGAEVGISTNKIHARGPVGLEGLTTYKYKLSGQGHIVADYAEGRKHFTHTHL
jgi:glutamate-5-semialdehyde dehydrogenase